MKDNIYFEKRYDGVIIKLKLKLKIINRSNDGTIILDSIFDEETRENILKNNDKFVHNTDDKKNLMIGNIIEPERKEKKKEKG